MHSSRWRIFWILGLATFISLLFMAAPTLAKEVWSHTDFDDKHIQTIVLLPYGFFPEKIYLQKGDTVRFFNATPHFFWPASDSHPTHSQYSEFDPTQPIASGHSWSFTIDREGTFAFHDHLKPEHTGIIVVGPDDFSLVTDEADCLKDARAKNTSCIELYFRNVTKEKKYSETVLLFKKLSATYPGNCHAFAHDLGKRAYEVYAHSTLPDIGPEASTCAYGFWHGFMTAMETNEGVNASKKFCSSLEASNQELLMIKRVSCYHGIGIGLIPDPPPPTLWGKAQLLIDPGLRFCDTIPGEEVFRDRCYQGVFHALSVYMMQQQYGFSFTEESLALCTQQALKYREVCYRQLATSLPIYYDNDFKRTVSTLHSTIASSSMFMTVFQETVPVFVDPAQPIGTTAKLLTQCRAINADLSTPCISGILNALFNAGKPGHEYILAIDFCSGSWIPETERAHCFKKVQSNAIYFYSSEKMKVICSGIPDAYRTPEICVGS